MIKNLITSDISGGLVLSLDRTMPPESVTYNDTYNMNTGRIHREWSHFDATQHCIKSYATRGEYPKDCYAYALTFTFNAKGMSHKPPLEQWIIFETEFDKWKSLFSRRMSALSNNKYFIAYEVYPELTKDGVIHAHGLFYYNIGYENTRTIMAKAWVDRTKIYGNKMSAMKKKNVRGGYDYAFDKCKNVTKWREYITKEHSNHTDDPCLVINPNVQYAPRPPHLKLKDTTDISLAYQQSRMDKIN